MRPYLVGVFTVMLLHVGLAEAGLNLGMKIACKQYGKAWNGGSKSTLRGVCTYDFYRQWARMPSDSFARLPRGGKGRVLSSHKFGGSGQVTVSTPHGIVTFSLVGGGFNWIVADIYKAGDDGRTVSLKSYLDATLTARKFMKDLKGVGGTAFYDSSSKQFRLAFADLSGADLVRIRKFLPDFDRTPKPHVVLGSKAATIRVQIPDQGPEDIIEFRMVRESGWKVNDFAIESTRAQIASFSQSLPLIARISEFGEFVENPQEIDPVSFTADGPLREVLVLVRNESPFPLKPSGNRLEFVVSEDFRSVLVRYPDKKARISFGQESGKQVIETVEIDLGQNWTDVAKLLGLKQRVRSLASFLGGKGLLESATPSPSEPATSTLTAVVATETLEKTSKEQPIEEKPAGQPKAKVSEPIAVIASTTEAPKTLDSEPAILTERQEEVDSPAKPEQPVIRQVEYIKHSSRRYTPPRKWRILKRRHCW